MDTKLLPSQNDSVFTERLITKYHDYGLIGIRKIAGHFWITHIDDKMDENLKRLITNIIIFYSKNRLLNVMGNTAMIEQELLNACLKHYHFTTWEESYFKKNIKSNSLMFPPALVEAIYRDLPRDKRMYILPTESKGAIKRTGPVKFKLYDYSYFIPNYPIPNHLLSDTDKMICVGGLRAKTHQKLVGVEKNINKAKSILSKYA